MLPLAQHLFFRTFFQIILAYGRISCRLEINFTSIRAGCPVWYLLVLGIHQTTPRIVASALWYAECIVAVCQLLASVLIPKCQLDINLNMFYFEKICMRNCNKYKFIHRGQSYIIFNLWPWPLKIIMSKSGKYCCSSFGHLI